MNTCHNNPKKSSTTKINKHTAFDYSLFTHFHLIQQKLNSIIIEVKKFMKNFCLDLKEQATKIINYEKKKK